MDLVEKYLSEYSGGSPVSQVMYGAYGSDIRRSAKTGKSRDFTRFSKKNTSGIVGPIELYYDPMAPGSIKTSKLKTKRILWGRNA